MIVETYLNGSTGVIGYTKSEYDIVNDMWQIFVVVSDYKVNKFQHVYWGIRCADYEYINAKIT